MTSDDNNQDVSADTTGAGEGKDTTTEEFRLSKAEYDELVGYKSTVGSLKRQIKDLTKPKEEPKETPQTKTEEFGLLQKTYLRSAGLADDDEVDLAKDIQKKTGLEWDKLVDDDYFQMKLKKLRDGKANASALDVKGGSNQSGGAKGTAEYWLSKGEPPTPKDVPDRKVRAKIIRDMQDNQKNAGGKFYND
jgi:hypothetical protein